MPDGSCGSAHAVCGIRLFSPDGGTLACVVGTQAQLFDLSAGKAQELGPSCPVDKRSAHAVVFMPDNSRLVTAGSDGTVRLWDVARATPRELSPFNENACYAIKVDFSADCRTLAAGSWGGAVRLWDSSSSRPTERPGINAAGFFVRALAFSPDGKTLAYGGSDEKASVWLADVTGNEPKTIARLGSHAEYILSVAISHDGKSLAYSTQGDPEVHLCEVNGSESKQRHVLRLPSVAMSVAFAPDSETIACGCADGSIQLWYLQGPAPKLIRELKHHIQSVYQVAFSPDGSQLASAGPDSIVRLWEWSNPGANDPVPLLERGHVVNGIAFAPDGKRIAAVHDDGQLIMWSVPDGKLLQKWT